MTETEARQRAEQVCVDMRDRCQLSYAQWLAWVDAIESLLHRAILAERERAAKAAAKEIYKAACQDPWEDCRVRVDRAIRAGEGPK